jgi:hypothetical protein
VQATQEQQRITDRPTEARAKHRAATTEHSRACRRPRAAQKQVARVEVQAKQASEKACAYALALLLMCWCSRTASMERCQLQVHSVRQLMHELMGRDLMENAWVAGRRAGLVMTLIIMQHQRVQQQQW